MNLHLALIKAFLNYETFNQSFRFLDANDIKENYPEIYKLTQCLPHIHKNAQAGNRSILDLEFALKTLYPNAQEASYKPLLQSLESMEVQPSSVASYLHTLQRRHLATEAAKKLLTYAEGYTDIPDFHSILAPLTEEPRAETQDFIDNSLDSIYDKQIADLGLQWRLQSLNQALGPLRKGDFGFVFARPETGKTTFLSSEVTYMAGQTDRPILWFNNEEQSEKVLLRCYQSALELEVHNVFKDRASALRRYTEYTRNNIKFPQFESCTKRGIEDLCRKYNPSLILLDQIDKISGFSGDRDDLELTAIYCWARELAKTYGPCIGICQAGASAEGKKWLTMNDVNNSKTGKQGEADWILGIGKSLDESFAYERYLHLSKNKLLGGQDAHPDMRHGKWAVRILPEIARYEDV